MCYFAYFENNQQTKTTEISLEINIIFNIFLLIIL